MGDIAIGNLHHHNLALLAKWIWCSLHEKDALWRNPIVAKYYSPTCIWPMVFVVTQNPYGISFVGLLI